MATEIKTTRVIRRIVDNLEEVRDCGHDMDLVKTAVEIYHEVMGEEHSPVESLCPFTEQECYITHCRNCEIWIRNSGLCVSH